jgi:hypothetical protein
MAVSFDMDSVSMGNEGGRETTLIFLFLLPHGKKRRKVGICRRELNYEKTIYKKGFVLSA